MDMIVRVLPGDGMVARLGAGVVVLPVPPEGPTGSGPLVLDRLRADLTDLDGVGFTSAVETWSHELGPLAAVAGSASGWAVLAPAGMRVHAVYADRESDRDGPLHVVQLDPLKITILPTAARPATTEMPHLGDVPLPGGGVVIETRAAPDPTAVGPVTTVEGLRCTCGTLVPPMALRCWSCGEALDTVDRSLTSDVRPPLGVLMVDDGRACALDEIYVIGRSASESLDVVEGRAAALDLRDVGRTLSRVHAKIVLHDWDVLITDEASANGTLVRPTDGWRWQRLEPNVPYRLLPGSDIKLGDHIIWFKPPSGAL